MRPKPRRQWRRTIGPCSMSRRRRKPGRRLESVATISRSWRGSGRRATGSIAATRGASRRPKSRPSPTRSTACPGAASPALRPFRHCCLIRQTRKVKPTPNLETLRRAAEALADAGRGRIEVNAPGTTSSATVQALAEAGATQIEPGHGLTGTTPLHAVEDLPEIPAVVYLTEVSHLAGGEAFCFGGGLYIDPVFPDYQVRAIVAREPTATVEALRNVEIPGPGRHRLLRDDRREGPIEASSRAIAWCSAFERRLS